MTLAELIATMPGEAGATDQQVLAWLEEGVTSYIDVPWLELQIWLTEQDIDRETLQTAATTGSASNRTAAQHVLDTLSAGLPLYASDPRVRSIVQASSLSGTAKGALVALAERTVPRWRKSNIDWSDPADTAETARRLHDIAEVRD